MGPVFSDTLSRMSESVTYSFYDEDIKKLISIKAPHCYGSRTR